MIQTSAPTRTHFYKEEATSQRGMLATKTEVATKAGIEMLEAGGNVIDAAVAACFAVGVTEPTSSGIGGGGYLVYQVGDEGGVIGFPMRASKSATPDMYEITGEGATGSFGWAPVANDANIHGFRSIAIPGAVAGLTEAHKRLGKLPLTDVVAPAVRAARDGFAPHWHTLLGMGSMAGQMFRYGELRRIFMPGDAMPTGGVTSPALLKQPHLAETLEAIGRDGADAFYRGDIARAIVEDIRANGGVLTEDDLASYRPFVWENGLEIEYRGRTVRLPRFACAGPTSAMTLNMVRGFDLTSMGHNSVEMLHSYISSVQLAYGDRFRYFGDPDFVDVPWDGLLSDAYAERRRASIGDSAPGWFKPGDPWQEEGHQPENQLPASLPAIDDGTTHLCAMDGEGNAVSLTNTLMSGFGSGIVPKGTGVVMNNGMMWFDPTPGRVNSIEPGKSGLNNMTPALVLGRDGTRIAVGASGGRRITNCVTQLIVKMVDFGMGPQEAIDSPRVDASNPWTSVDPRLDPAVRAALESKGHRLVVMNEGLMRSGFASPTAIIRDSDGFRAGVDTFHAAYAEGL